MQQDVGPNLIYGLIDPRTRLIRYVGLSSKGHKRPNAHRLRSCEDTYCRRWVKTLQALGLDYEIAVLESVEHKNALGPAEIWWIAYGKASGWPLTNMTSGGEGSFSEESLIKRRRKRSEYIEQLAQADADRLREFFSPSEVEARNRYLLRQYGIPAALEQRCFQFYDARRARLKYFEPQQEVEAAVLISAVTAEVHVTRETAAALHEKWMFVRGIDRPLKCAIDKLPVPEPIPAPPAQEAQRAKAPRASSPATGIVAHYFCIPRDHSSCFMCACGHEEPFEDQDAMARAIANLNAHVQRETAPIQWRISCP